LIVLREGGPAAGSVLTQDLEPLFELEELLSPAGPRLGRALGACPNREESKPAAAGLRIRIAGRLIPSSRCWPRGRSCKPERCAGIQRRAGGKSRQPAQAGSDGGTAGAQAAREEGGASTARATGGKAANAAHTQVLSQFQKASSFRWRFRTGSHRSHGWDDPKLRQAAWCSTIQARGGRPKGAASDTCFPNKNARRDHRPAPTDMTDEGSGTEAIGPLPFRPFSNRASSSNRRQLPRTGGPGVVDGGRLASRGSAARDTDAPRSWRPGGWPLSGS